MKDKLIKVGYLIGLLCLIASVTFTSPYVNQLRVSGAVVLLVSVIAEVLTRRKQ